MGGWGFCVKAGSNVKGDGLPVRGTVCALPQQTTEKTEDSFPGRPCRCGLSLPMELGGASRTGVARGWAASFPRSRDRC